MSTSLASVLGEAALARDERRVVERLLGRLQQELGEDLKAVWLYGSRARGEADPSETDPDRRSDVDLLAVVDPSRDAREAGWWALPMVEEEADAVGDSPVYYSLRVFDADWLRERREIRSFFIQEVDRDKSARRRRRRLPCGSRADARRLKCHYLPDLRLDSVTRVDTEAKGVSMSYNLQAAAGSRWPEATRLSQLFADALRMRVLGECNAQEMSPQSFRSLVGGCTLARATEAFELLAQYDWLERTRSDDAENFYRATAVPIVTKEAFEELPDSTKALAVSRIFDALIARAKEAMKAGTICARADAHLTWTALELDRQGWEVLIGRLDSVFFMLAEEQERARARMEETGEESIQMTVALLGFESPKNPERKSSQVLAAKT